MKRKQDFPTFVDPDSDHQSNPLAIGLIIMAACVTCGVTLWAILQVVK